MCGSRVAGDFDGRVTLNFPGLLLLNPFARRPQVDSASAGRQKTKIPVRIRPASSSASGLAQ